MNFDNESSKPDTEEYSFIKQLPSPIGKLWYCRHNKSLEYRALKYLRPDLLDKPSFQAFYIAALTLAHGVANHLSLDNLLPPIINQDGKFINEYKGKYFVERRWVNDSTVNLNEFIEKYHSRAGLKDECALAIMVLLTSTLSKMHNARFIGDKNIPLSGIPHLNLKPQNILIGPDPKTQNYHVYLPDFCISLSSRLVEEAGISAPLNYSSARLLGDKKYFGLPCDIFSCGLLLYKMVERQDLIPSGLRRETTVSFIHKELPKKLHNLNLTHSSAKCRNIIMRCLTQNSSESYSTMDQLHNDVLRAFGKADPGNVLKNYCEKPPPPPPPDNWWSKAKKWLRQHKIAIFAVFLVIVLGVTGILFGPDLYYRFYDKPRWIDKVKIYIDEINTGRNRLGGLTCNVPILESPIKDTLEAYNLRGSAREELLSKIKNFSNDVEHTITICYSLTHTDKESQRLNDEKQSSISNSSNLAKVDQIKYTIDSILVNGNAFLQMRNFSKADRANQIAGGWLDSLRNITEPFECENDVTGLRNVFNSLSSDCRQEGNQLYQDARQACDQGDSTRLRNLIAQFNDLRNEQRCQKQDEVDSQTVAALVADAKNNLEKFDNRYLKISGLYNLETNYVNARVYLNKAEKHLNNNDLSKAKFNAESSLNSLKQSKPCEGAALQYKEFEKCTPIQGLSSEMKEQKEIIREFLRAGDCDDANNGLDTLEAMLDCDEPPPPPPPPPPPDTIDFKSCLASLNNGEPDAWKCFYNISKSDPNYGYSRSHLIRALGKTGRFEPPHDTILKNAFREALSRELIPPLECDLATVEIYIIMTYCYGQDTATIEPSRVKDHFDRAYGCGAVVEETGMWWRAMLAYSRSLYFAWRDTGKRPQDRAAAINFLDESIIYMINLPNNLNDYIEELRFYKNQILHNN
jgi:serine/threonine protein kinase